MSHWKLRASREGVDGWRVVPEAQGHRPGLDIQALRLSLRPRRRPEPGPTCSGRDTPSQLTNLGKGMQRRSVVEGPPGCRGREGTEAGAERRMQGAASTISAPRFGSYVRLSRADATVAVVVR